MDDYAKAVAAPPSIVLGGVTYRVSRQGPRIYGELQQFLKSHVPDPRIMAKDLCRDLPDAVALQVWRDLCEEAKDWPPSLESHEGNLILTTTLEGSTQVVYTLLRRHCAEMTLERARSIAEDITTEQVGELIRLSMPEPNFDPKARPDPTTTDRGPVPV
jgi:hypothetical protein